MTQANAQAMTQEQRRYFINRLDEITQEKLAAKRTELGLDGCGPQAPTWGQVFEAIKAGECVLKEDTVDLRRPYLNPEDVTWPELDNIKATYEANVKALQAYKVALEVERKKALDTVMLEGTAQAALAAYAKA